MIYRQTWSALLGMLLLALGGCQPGDRILLDDSKNPDVASGLNKVSAMDHDAAIESFERALVANPASVRSHYELGLLYERQKREYVTAIYHYNRVLKHQQTGWPAENARLLIDGCRQELIKAEALAPVALAMQREIERLRSENLALKEQLAGGAANPLLASSPSTSTSPPPAPRTAPEARHAAPGPTESASMRLISSGSITPATSATPSSGSPSGRSLRVHRVRAGETLASIGRSYNVSLTQMLAANPSIKPRYLSVGSVVNIPAR